MAQGLDGACLRTAALGNIALAKGLCWRISDPDQQLRSQNFTAILIGTPGCSVQDCIKVVTVDTSYIVKIPRNHTLAGRRIATTEARWARWASDLGLSPRVLLVDEETGGFVTNFIDGRTLEDPQTPAKIEELVGILRKLHCQKPHPWMKSAKDPAANVEGLIQEVQGKHSLDADIFELLRHAIPIAKSALAQFEPESEPCRNDFHTENVLLDQQNRIWCINFECAGLSDPMWDLAYLAASANSVDLYQLAQLYRASVKQRERLEFFYCLSLTQTILWFATNGPAGIELRDAYLRRLKCHLNGLCSTIATPTYVQDSASDL